MTDISALTINGEVYTSPALVTYVNTQNDEITRLRAENDGLRAMQLTVLVEQGNMVASLRAEVERLRAALLRLRGLTSGMVRGYIDDALGGKP